MLNDQNLWRFAKFSYLVVLYGLECQFFYYLNLEQPMIETTESVLCTPELQDLELKFKEITLEMENYAKEGKYVLAETCRVNAEQIKKELQGKKVTEVEKRQKKENKEVKKLLKDQLADFNKEWDAKIDQYIWESKKWIVELKDKQAKEKQQCKQKLQLQIPQKWKDSSECLNLKKIEQGLAKQQNYVQALKVQKQVRELQKKEQDAWCKIRNEKIETGLDQLKAKQDVQTKALEKRIQSGKAELQIEKLKAEGRLVLKQANVSKDIQSQNKKEYLSTKGDFKSRAEVLSPNRSKILSPNSRSKLLLSMTR